MDFRQSLLNRRTPPILEQWEVIPYPSEVFFADAPLTYARYYGMDVSYSQSSSVAVGHPAFVLAAMTGTAIGNAANRSQAHARARDQWREWQTARVFVTTHRLVVNANGRWLSFDYSQMTAVYPEVAAGTLVCQFTAAEPLMVQGPHVATAAVMTVFATRGIEGVARHPGLTLMDPLPAERGGRLPA